MDLRAADLPLLLALEALVAERSVTRAARRLNLSQPAMSAQLARLRDIFGDPLLTGNAHGMVPTRRAEALAEALKEPLAEIARVVRSRILFDPGQSRETVRLVGSEYTNSVIAVPLMARLAALAPHMRLAVFAFQSHRGAQQFGENDIDLGILTPSMDLAGLMTHDLFADDLVVARRRGHPDAGPLTIEGYCAARHVLVSTTGGRFAANVDDALGALGRSRQVVASVQSFSVAASMVAATDLLTTLPRGYGRQLPDRLEVVELPLDVPCFGFRMVWPRRLETDPMHLWLRAQVVDIAQEAFGAEHDGGQLRPAPA